MNKLKYLSFLFAALVSVGCMFTSCDDDDDNFPIDEQIAGEYKGTLDIAMGGQDVMTGDPKNVEITKAAGNAITMALPEFSFQGMSLGSITLDHIVLSQEGANTYSFTDVRTLTLADPVGACSVESFGVITSNSFTINMEIVWNEISITVAYVGNRLNGTESADNALLAFWFDPSNEANAIVTSQADHLEAGQTTITFSVDENATDEQLAALVPTIQVSDGAEYTLGTSSYSKGKTVTVVAENGDVAVYTVKVASKTNTLKYTFDEWESVAGSGLSNAYDKPMPTNELATSAEGAGMLKLYGVTDVPVYKSTDDKVAGEAAAKFVTMDTSEKANKLVPAITSGTAFTGSFDLSPIMSGIFGGGDVDRLSSTRFGIPYDKKPLRFTGYYKYTPGEKFIDGTDYENIVTLDQVDECSIQAVLYEAATDDFVLTGHDINTSETRVAVAALPDGSAKAEWTAFDLEFEWLDGKTYDPTKSYKLAIVCSSSKEGDLFKGAGGSTLMLDELEVIGENVTAE